MDPSRKPITNVRGSIAPQGRPLPPPPPAGPVSRVSAGLLLRRPAEPLNNGVRIPFGLPNLRRNVCPHFYVTGPRGTFPIQAPHLLKALMRQDANVSRCQLRGGVHLEQGYVSDICLSSRFNQCVFYEDELTAR